ncbi:hypothetical protein [Spirochaeta thermophila]|nr:hypothetical protein [Spirochaeta thermophila]
MWGEEAWEEVWGWYEERAMMAGDEGGWRRWVEEGVKVVGWM